METRGRLLDRITRELAAHTAIEEELFSHALIAATGDIEYKRMVAEGIEEHRAVDSAGNSKVIPDLWRSDPSTVEYAGQARVLKDFIFHHLKEEEEEMFPRVRERIGRRELRE